MFSSLLGKLNCERERFARCANAHLSRKRRGEDGAPKFVAAPGFVAALAGDDMEEGTGWRVERAASAVASAESTTGASQPSWRRVSTISEAMRG